MGKLTTETCRGSLALLGLCLSATLANATQDADELGALAVLRDQIELSYQVEDARGIEQARQELLGLAMDPLLGDRAAYYAAYARFRQGLAAEQDAPAARRYLDDCILELGAYVERNPGDAEARALLGSCYGISTRYHRLAMASRGLEARRQMAEARELAPDNPWVMLQDGLADYSTPRLFGGDRDTGIRKLERATMLFAAAADEGSHTAAWGAAEAWLQLARMYTEEGRSADAIQARARAEALAPDRAAAPARVAAAF